MSVRIPRIPDKPRPRGHGWPTHKARRRRAKARHLRAQRLAEQQGAQ